MATSTIKGGTVVIPITFSSAVTDGTANVIYDASTGIVQGTFSCRNTSSDIGMGTALFTIPSGYRPKSTISYPCIIINSGTTHLFYYGFVNTAGNVSQNGMSGARNIFGSFSYTI